MSSYLGNTPNIGSKKLLSLSGSSPATQYTLQYNSQNYSTETQNILVSVNGVVQVMDGTAYTVANSTITFSESVATSAVDFIITTGEKIDTSNVSDGVINTSSLNTNFVLQNNSTFTDITIPTGKNAMLVGPVAVTGTLTVNGVLVVV